ncbi:MAG: HEAT repeat domain-containing protein [Planctomycetota bacterium]
MNKKTVLLTVPIGLLLVIAIVASSSAGSPEETNWANATKAFTADGNGTDPEKRVTATRNLADAIYGNAESKACELLARQLKDELARAKNGRSEEEVEFGVIDACVSGFKKTTQDKAVQYLIKAASDKAADWRVKFHIIQGLGGINQDQTKTALLELLKTKDARIQIAAIDSLSQLQCEIAQTEVGDLLAAAPEWEVKVAAIDYFAKIKSKDSIPMLIKALKARIDSRAKENLISLLEELSGKKLGSSAKAWEDWWQTQKEGENIDPNMTTAVYYGVKASSTKILFLLDLSNSMNWSAGDAAQQSMSTTEQALPSEKLFVDAAGKPASAAFIDEMQKKRDKINARKIETRIILAKRELVNVIYNLHPSVYFNMVFYSDSASAWGKTLVQATADNKKNAIEFVDTKVGTGGWTFFWEGLEAAYRFIPQKGKIELSETGDYVGVLGGVDTIFLVSDGPPDSGKLLKKGQGSSFGNKEQVKYLQARIKEQLNKINPIRRIKINTISVGRPDRVADQTGCYDPCPDFLAELSKMTGGISVDKTTK